MARDFFDMQARQTGFLTRSFSSQSSYHLKVMVLYHLIVHGVFFGMRLWFLCLPVSNGRIMYASVPCAFLALSGSVIETLGYAVL